MPNRTTIPIICGSTATGKTDLAMELAKSIPLEVVSADSRTVIRHLDIGTAKPTAAQQQRVPFHLINLIEPGERYSAMRFVVDAELKIKEIFNRGHLPVIVGGTGLYLSALTRGIVEIVEEDLAVRERLAREYESRGADEMWSRLKQVDPLEAAKVHPNHKTRLLRALEIFEITKRSKSELIAHGAYKRSEHDFTVLCLLPEREKIYEAINLRVETMMQAGLLNEVEALVKQGFQERLMRANVIGYNELLEHLSGKLTLSESVVAIQQNTRQFAKRQSTWFRNQTFDRFFESADQLVTAFRDLKSLCDK